MYSILKTVHSYWAFFVLIILLIAIFNALIKRILRKPFNSTDLRISLFGLIFSHIQLFIGLILYFISPWFGQWSSLGTGVMKNNESRLFLVVHPVTNILAILFITIGWSLQKKQSESSKKFLRITLFYGFGYILLLSRIPWSIWI